MGHPLERIKRLARRLYGVSCVAVVLGAEGSCPCSFGLPAGESGMGCLPYCEQADAWESTVLVPDLQQDARFQDHPLLSGDGGIRFVAWEPLRGPTGSLLGGLCLLDRQPRCLNGEELDLLQDLAGLAGALVGPGGPVGEADDGGRLRHALRNPLTSILGPVSYLLTGAGGDLSPHVRTVLEVVERSAESMAALLAPTGE